MSEITSAGTEAWTERVRAWRASGESANEFCRGAGYAANTLRWWSSKLKKESSANLASSEIRLAKVVRTGSPKEAAGSAIVIEIPRSGIRIGIERGVDRATLAIVLDTLGVGVQR